MVRGIHTNNNYPIWSKVPRPRQVEKGLTNQGYNNIERKINREVTFKTHLKNKKIGGIYNE